MLFRKTGTLDFFAVNHYTSRYVTSGATPANTPHSFRDADVNFESDPQWEGSKAAEWLKVNIAYSHWNFFIINFMIDYIFCLRLFLGVFGSYYVGYEICTTILLYSLQKMATAIRAI